MNVIIGPVAVRIGRYWVGVASGNRYSAKRRLSWKTALADAEKMELKE